MISETSSIIHGQPRSRMGCIIHSFIVSELLQSRDIMQAVEQSRKRLDVLKERNILMNDLQQELSAYGRLLNSNIDILERHEISSSGYVVSTLEAAVWCLATSGSFEECLLKAVNLGDDTDTVGAVAGGLAGLYWGIEGIPAEWLEALAKGEMIFSMVERFIGLV